MATTLTLHDSSVEVTSPTAGASVILSVALRDPNFVGPRTSEDLGARIARAAGRTPDGMLRRIRRLAVTLEWRSLLRADTEELAAFYDACAGPRREFYLTAAGVWVWPVTPFAGATLQSGSSLTPTTALYPTSKLELSAGSTVSFPHVRFSGELELDRVADRRTGGQEPAYDVVIALDIEMPEE